MVIDIRSHSPLPVEQLRTEALGLHQRIVRRLRCADADTSLSLRDTHDRYGRPLTLCQIQVRLSNRVSVLAQQMDRDPVAAMRRAFVRLARLLMGRLGKLRCWPGRVRRARSDRPAPGRLVGGGPQAPAVAGA